MSFHEDGKEVLIPTVHPDGYIMSGEEAVEYYRENNSHFGKYESVEEANKAAEDIHQSQAELLPDR